MQPSSWIHFPFVMVETWKKFLPNFFVKFMCVLYLFKCITQWLHDFELFAVWEKSHHRSLLFKSFSVSYSINFIFRSTTTTTNWKPQKGQKASRFDASKSCSKSAQRKGPQKLLTGQREARKGFLSMSTRFREGKIFFLFAKCPFSQLNFRAT